MSVKCTDGGDGDLPGGYCRLVVIGFIADKVVVSTVTFLLKGPLVLGTTQARRVCHRGFPGRLTQLTLAAAR